MRCLGSGSGRGAEAEALKRGQPARTGTPGRPGRLAGGVAGLPRVKETELEAPRGDRGAGRG